MIQCSGSSTSCFTRIVLSRDQTNGYADQTSRGITDDIPSRRESGTIACGERKMLLFIRNTLPRNKLCCVKVTKSKMTVEKRLLYFM